MEGLWDDFWGQKGESGREGKRTKDGVKAAVAKIQSCQIAFNLRLISHRIPHKAGGSNFQEIESLDSLFIVFSTYIELFNTPKSASWDLYL
jgi:hypothetical protein